MNWQNCTLLEKKTFLLIVLSILKRQLTNTQRILVLQDITYILYPTGMLISCIFLLLTLFVYIVDKELHKALFGKITIGFVVNNLAAYLCLAVVYLGKR